MNNPPNQMAGAFQTQSTNVNGLGMMSGEVAYRLGQLEAPKQACAERPQGVHFRLVEFLLY